VASAVDRPLQPHTRGRGPTVARSGRLRGPRRCGTTGRSLPVAHVLRGRGRGHESGGGGVPGKEIGGEAHPNGGASVGQ
jgi:hypothetical protein